MGGQPEHPSSRLGPYIEELLTGSAFGYRVDGMRECIRHSPESGFQKSGPVVGCSRSEGNNTFEIYMRPAVTGSPKTPYILSKSKLNS